MRPACLASAFLLTALASLSAPASAADYGGWGLRVGGGTDPDQIVAGVHLTFNEIARDWRMVPNLELATGDDVDMAVVTLPMHYLFRSVDAGFTPYAGAGVSLGWVDHDRPRRRGDEDFEIALRGIGGLEWRFDRTDFFVELNVIAGDLHDVQAMLGWTFRR